MLLLVLACVAANVVFLDEIAHDRATKLTDTWVVFYMAGEQPQVIAEANAVFHRVKGVAKVGVVDVDVTNVKVHIVPSITLFVPPRILAGSPITVPPPYDARHISKWILNIIPTPKIHEVSLSTLKKFVDVSTKPKVLLLTERTTVSPLFRTLVDLHERDLHFGISRGSDLHMKMLFGLRSLPALVLITNRVGDEYFWMPYTEAITEDNMPQFINGVQTTLRTGKLQASAVPPQTATGSSTAREGGTASTAQNPTKDAIASVALGGAAPATRPTLPVGATAIAQLVPQQGSGVLPCAGQTPCVVALLSSSLSSLVSNVVSNPDLEHPIYSAKIKRQPKVAIADLSQIAKGMKASKRFSWVNVDAHPNYAEVFGAAFMDAPLLVGLNVIDGEWFYVLHGTVWSRPSLRRFSRAILQGEDLPWKRLAAPPLVELDPNKESLAAPVVKITR